MQPNANNRTQWAFDDDDQRRWNRYADGQLGLPPLLEDRPVYHPQPATQSGPLPSASPRLHRAHFTSSPPSRSTPYTPAPFSGLPPQPTGPALQTPFNVPLPLPPARDTSKSLEPGSPQAPSPRAARAARSSTQAPAAGSSAPEKHSVRAKFSEKENLELIKATLAVNPYGAVHGSKGKKWDEVKERLAVQGLCSASTADSLKQKMSKLMECHTDPKPNSSLAQEVTAGPSKDIYGGLLDKACTLHDKAVTQSEEEKAVSRAKLEKDRRGGEAIRNASLTELQPNSSDDNSADDESDHDKENKPRKRRRLMHKGESSTAAPSFDIPSALAHSQAMQEAAQRRNTELMERSLQVQYQTADMQRETAQANAASSERIAKALEHLATKED